MTIWAALQQCASELREPFTRDDILAWFRQHRPDLNPSSVSTHIQLATGNAPSNAISAYAARQPILRRVARATYRRFESGTTVTGAPHPLIPQPLAASIIPNTASPRILLISCSKAKLDHAAPARELYSSHWFRLARRYAEDSGDPWYIVSGKYGLLGPDDVIGPYDVYLADMSTHYRQAWGRFVVEQLNERVQISGVRIEIHAAAPYVAALRAPLEAGAALVDAPLEGRTQGQWLSFPAYRAVAPGPPPPAQSPPQPLPQHRSDTPAGEVAICLCDPDARVAARHFPVSPTPALQLPGLYAWWVDAPGADALSSALGHPLTAGLVYAGQAGARRAGGGESRNTLWLRLTTMHLAGSQEFSTLRLTLSSILRLIDDDLQHEAPLSAWMRQHLSVSWVPMQADELLTVEDAVLDIIDPPLNLAGRPRSPLRRRLTELRRRLTAGETDGSASSDPAMGMLHPGRSAEVSRRVAGLISEFADCVNGFDQQVPFARSGQYESHRATIDRRRIWPDVQSALDDDVFLDLLYETLGLWGIGRRASRLVPVTEFRERLRSRRDDIATFESSRLDDPDLDPALTGAGLWTLIERLEIVDNVRLIVSGTKALHHLLPDLVPPMDRAWTGAFFLWSVAPEQSAQRATFVRTFSCLAEVACATEPSRYVGNGWRTSITKVVDNAVIGFCKAHDIRPAGSA